MSRRVTITFDAADPDRLAAFDEVTVWTVMHDPEGNEFCVV